MAIDRGWLDDDEFQLSFNFLSRDAEVDDALFEDRRVSAIHEVQQSAIPREREKLGRGTFKLCIPAEEEGTVDNGLSRRERRGNGWRNRGS